MFNTKKTVLLEDLIAELLKSWSFSTNNFYLGFTSNLESLAKIHVENLVTMVPPLIFSTKEVNIQIKAGIRTKSGLLLGI